MEHNLKLIIFDLDGTLIDSKKDIAQAANHTLHILGYAVLDEEVIYEYVGDGVKKLLERCLGENDYKLIDKAWEIFCRYYRYHLLDNTILFPGIEKVLDYFRFLDKVIISNKPDQFCMPILEGLGIHSYFKLVLGGESLPRRKPDPAAVYLVMEKFSLTPKQMMIIGDSGIDIECGKRAGIYTCGVTYGFRNRKELIEAGPDYLIDRPDALMSILERNSLPE